MKKYILQIAVVGFVISTKSAQACIMYTGLNIEDVSFADVVVIGTVENYEIVKDRDMAFGSLGDYARFEVLVDETIVGDVSKRFTATWDNSTFGEPASLPNEQLFMAFRDAESSMPPLQGPSATISPTPEPQLLTVLQAPCGAAFLFGSSSEAAQKVQEFLATGDKSLANVPFYP